MLASLTKKFFCILEYCGRTNNKYLSYVMYLRSKNGVVWLRHSLVNLYLYICVIISSCYGSIPLTLGLLGRDGGSGILCHSCGFACQQRVLKTFSTSRYLHSKDRVVWLWHSLVNFSLSLSLSLSLYIYISQICISIQSNVQTVLCSYKQE